MIHLERATIMAVGSFRRVSIYMVFMLIIWLSDVKTYTVPCTTPLTKGGFCVPIQRCRNIFNIVQNPTPPPRGISNYINRAACTLPSVERSICCLPEEVIELPTPITRVPPSANILPKECGITISDRISRGNVTQVFAYPWMALLYYRDGDEQIFEGCGGSLINDRYVLTAAHCLIKNSVKLDHVRLGEHTLNQDEDCRFYPNGEQDCAGPVEDYNVESFVIHPNYVSRKIVNDIGLVRLDRTVIMKDHIKPICLPVDERLQSMQLEKYIVTGWGTTEEQSRSNVLLEAVLPRVDLDICQEKMTRNRLRIKLSDKQMCAGGENLVDACQGDSGGPLGFITKHNGKIRFVQFGIVSAGVSSCGVMSVPGIYSRVGSYMDWILENVGP